MDTWTASSAATQTMDSGPSAVGACVISPPAGPAKCLGRPRRPSAPYRQACIHWFVIHWFVTGRPALSTPDEQSTQRVTTQPSRQTMKHIHYYSHRATGPAPNTATQISILSPLFNEARDDRRRSMNEPPIDA